MLLFKTKIPPAGSSNCFQINIHDKQRLFVTHALSEEDEKDIENANNTVPLKIVQVL
jgi:hypothetical protein